MWNLPTQSIYYDSTVEVEIWLSTEHVETVYPVNLSIKGSIDPHVKI